MNKTVKKHLLIFSVLALYIIIILASQIYCPIRTFTGIACPACGSSRAFVSLLHLDLRSYAYYNIMAVPLFLAVMLGVHINVLPISKKTVNSIIIFISVIAVIYYFYRTYFSLIP